jgi:hypothetical protein
MKNTPLLPRSWPWPTAGVGADHSMCNWQSPKLCFVLMSLLPTTIAPFSTFHPAACSQADRSLPSNNTIASDGGSAAVLPGVTTGGLGHLMPGMYSWPMLQEVMAMPSVKTATRDRIAFGIVRVRVIVVIPGKTAVQHR